MRIHHFVKEKKDFSQIPERQTVLYITMPSYVKILFLTMYFIGVFIKTRQLFFNTIPPRPGVFVSRKGVMTKPAKTH